MRYDTTETEREVCVLQSPVRSQAQNYPLKAYSSNTPALVMVMHCPHL